MSLGILGLNEDFVQLTYFRTRQLCGYELETRTSDGYYSCLRQQGACIISLFLLTVFKLIYKTHFSTKLTKFILYLTLNDKNTIVLCQIATKSINIIAQPMYCFSVVLYNLRKK